ncbi:unnamed protein product, partial [marine sediment metagenome]
RVPNTPKTLVVETCEIHSLNQTKKIKHHNYN